MPRPGKLGVGHRIANRIREEKKFVCDMVFEIVNGRKHRRLTEIKYRELCERIGTDHPPDLRMIL